MSNNTEIHIEVNYSLSKNICSSSVSLQNITSISSNFLRGIIFAM